MVWYCMHTYVIGKNDSCWNYFRIGGKGGIKENGGEVNSSMIDLIYSKNFGKCQNACPLSTTSKKRKKCTKTKKSNCVSLCTY
jgi:hypothetical protein